MASSPRWSILVVDDEPDIVGAIAETLEALVDGARVHRTHSGAEALALLEREQVHLIITDYRMPQMDGLQFLAKAQALAPTVPKIVLTAHPEPRLAINALQAAHIINFLTKPVDAEDLAAAVSHALQKGQDDIGHARELAAALEGLRRSQGR